jgi:hypothetical protein
MLSRLRRLRAELGTVDSLLHAIDRTLRFMSGNAAYLSCLYLLAQSVRDNSLLPPGRGSSIIVREATIQDAERLDWACGRDVARARLTEGMVGLLAFHRDRLIGYIWVRLGSYQDELLPLELTPSPPEFCAWGLDLFIHPEHRKSFTFARLWAAVFALMRERRLTWIMSSVSATNRLSIASHDSLGAICVGKVVVLVLGRFVAVLQSSRPRLTAVWAQRLRVMVCAPAMGTARDP